MRNRLAVWVELEDILPLTQMISSQIQQVKSFFYIQMRTEKELLGMSVSGSEFPGISCQD